jgi:hypothetical protein
MPSAEAASAREQAEFHDATNSSSLILAAILAASPACDAISDTVDVATWHRRLISARVTPAR